jgi:hypothetical protein
MFTERAALSVALAAMLAPAARAAAPSGIDVSSIGEFDPSVVTASGKELIGAGPQLLPPWIGCGRNVVQNPFLDALFGESATNEAGGNGSLLQSVFGAAGPITLLAPAGALPPGTLVTLQGPCGFPSAGGGLRRLGPGVGVEILSSRQPLRPVTLTVSYANVDVARLHPDRFVVARYEEDSKVWIPLETRWDGGEKTVTAAVDHFSRYEVFELDPAGGLAEAPVKAFPNPLKPAEGGRRFTFTGLPAGSSVRFYTMLGELLGETSSDPSGLAFWDARSKSGADVASGVYLAYVRSGGDSRIIKIAVER